MTVHPAGTRSDALRLQASGVDVQLLAAVGTIPGVVVQAAGGANGPGTGRLRSTGLGADRLSWRAPGSSSWGPSVDVSGGGQFVVEDGDDPAAFVRVSVSTTYLASSPQEALVLLQDLHNELGPDGVSAAEASAGLVETWTLGLSNESPHELQGVKAWLDAATSGVELSDDGATWVTPTSEEDASVLELGDVAPGASLTLHLRRTIGAGAAADPDVLNLVHYAWDGA